MSGDTGDIFNWIPSQAGDDDPSLLERPGSTPSPAGESLPSIYCGGWGEVSPTLTAKPPDIINEIMRLNKYLSLSLNISRRAADDLIAAKKVKLNGQVAILGSRVEPEQDTVQYLGKKLQITERELTYILLNKPAGYLSSKVSQGGAPTLYELLPKKYQKLNLNIAGRLDKDSCGLILLTNDGDYLNQLIHPKFNKTKTYLVKLSKEISEADLIKLKAGIQIGDSRPSKFQQIEPIPHSGGQPNEVSAGGAGTAEKRGSSSLPWEGTSPQAMAGGVYQIQLTEGRNRQIRRTFYELGYKVKYLQRTQLGLFKLGSLKEGEHEEVKKD